MPDVSASSAIGASAWAALSGAPALTALAPVFQHVPQGTEPPIVIVADIEEDAEAFGAKGDDQDVSATLVVVTLVRGESRKALFDIEHQVRLALKDRRETRSGWDLAFTYAGTTGVLWEDGQTYEGQSRFTVIALAND